MSRTNFNGGASSGPIRSAQHGKIQYDIHDNDNEIDWVGRRQQVHLMLLSPWFDLGIGVVIGANAISIGIEQSLQIQGQDTIGIQIVESFFLCCYIFELGLRIFAERLACFQDNWVKFDAFLIALGVTTSWIIEPFLNESPDAFGPLMVLRIGRLLRLAKAGRMFSKVEDFWILIRSFLNSASIMLYTFLMLFLIMYVFSSLGVEVITKHSMNLGSDPDEDFQKHVAKYFSSFSTTMLTLVRFVCMDGMADIYVPLVEKDWRLVIYFIAVILIICIVIMNIITAVIFNSVLTQNHRDEDAVKESQVKEWRKNITNMKHMFNRLDQDNSGQLSRDELLNLNQLDKDKLCHALGVNTPIQLFNALDVDQSGQVSITEFIDAFWELTLSKGGLNLKRMEKQVETMHWRIKDAFESQFEMHRQIEFMKGTVDDIKRKVETDLASLPTTVDDNIKEKPYDVKLAVVSNGNSTPRVPKNNGVAKKVDMTKATKSNGSRASGPNAEGPSKTVDITRHNGTATKMATMQAPHAGVASTNVAKDLTPRTKEPHPRKSNSMQKANSKKALSPDTTMVSSNSSLARGNNLEQNDTKTLADIKAPSMFDFDSSIGEAKETNPLRMIVGV